MARADRRKHRRGDLPGIGSFFLPKNILSSEQDAAARDHVMNDGERIIGRAKDELDSIGHREIFISLPDILRQLQARADIQIHLPVRYDSAAFPHTKLTLHE